MTESIYDIFDYESDFWDKMKQQMLHDTKDMDNIKKSRYFNAISGKGLIKSALNIDDEYDGQIGDDIDNESVRMIRGKNILIVAATNRKRLNHLLDQMIGKVLVKPIYSNTLNFKNDIVHIYTFDMTDMSTND